MYSEDELEALFQRRYAADADPVSVKKDDLKIQNILARMPLFKNMFAKQGALWFKCSNQEGFKELDELIGFGYQLIETFAAVLNAYTPDSGRFIAYFTGAFSLNVSRALRREARRKRNGYMAGVGEKEKLSVNSLQESLGTTDDDLTIEDSLEASEPLPEEVFELNNEVEEAFSLLNSLYLEKKKNADRAAGYTFRVLDILRIMSDKQVSDLISKNDFLKTQEKVIWHIRRNCPITMKITQNMFVGYYQQISSKSVDVTQFSRWWRDVEAVGRNWRLGN